MLIRINDITFETDKGNTIQKFAEELCEEFKKHNKKFYGIFNGIKLIVDEHENPASLYWQYMYKLELERSK